MEPPITRWKGLRSLKRWLHDHPTAMYVFIGVGLILAASVVAAIMSYQKPEPMTANVTKPKPAEPKPVYYSPLTGEVISAKSKATTPVTAIMIENSPDARPQSGLKDAEVVYEAVAEGGITRFLALYQQKKPKLVGPVRSLRPYYVEWLRPYNASVAHVGGSAKALSMVRSGSYRDIDQFFNPGTYWHASDRYAPHNVYTSFKQLDALNKAKGYKSSAPKPFKRGDSPVNGTTKATTVDIDISGPTYNSRYTYNAKKKSYARSQAGAPHMDREKGQVFAKVVVTLMVDMRSVFEDGYRESIVTSGSGRAYVFTEGRVRALTWRKQSPARQLSFVNSSGKEVELARGATWITAVPKGSGGVKWK